MLIKYFNFRCKVKFDHPYIVVQQDLTKKILRLKILIGL